MAKEDMEPVLALILSRRTDLVFWLFTTSENESPVEVQVYDVANVDVKGHAISETEFLVMPRSILPVVRQSSSGKYFSLTQLRNPGSIRFRPAGLYSEDVVIAGELSTDHKDPESLALFRLFSNAIKKGSTSIRGHRVGPRALEVLRRGGRLTWSIDSPQEFDLSEPEN